ncbi:PstS family phosphate ABC transporter substrate-binding protein [Luteimonas huabeiensis]|uniref:PstS family phosphate ABC transporter substrate-binding protein n=1 Tax=Luteimonas huabeiensis TaxID=1244513 RepID=UPI00046331A7|nr:substrate-binding domain-containing protein [Luteimonas huabeiensis]
MLRTSFLRLNLLAAAMVVAGAAGAADLYGGGATFPVQSYVGNSFLSTVPVDARLSRNTVNPVATAPIANLTPPNTVFARFAAGTGHRISYCQSGSGTGLSLLTGSGSVTNATGECGNYTGSPVGFSSPNVAPDYIGTDTPINQANITAFSGGPRAARGGMWQIPTLAGAIALPRHSGTNVANLSIAQICQIYAGTITAWNQIPGSGSTAPIRIVHRSDSSGTSFAFTGWLARSCNNNANSSGVPANYFSANPVFTSGVPTGPLAGRLSSASGNPGLVTAVTTTASSIGYADYPEVAAQRASFVTVNSLSPASLGGAGSPTVNVAPPLSGQVLNPTTNMPVPATGAACLRLIPPGTPAATGSYPILAYTYLAGYRTNTVANRDALRSLLGYFLSTQANRPAPPAGFAYLDGNDAYRGSIQDTIDSCIE